jgi:hypothetical protein
MFLILKKEGDQTFEVAQAETREAAEKFRASLAERWKAEYLVQETQSGADQNLTGSN